MRLSRACFVLTVLAFLAAFAPAEPPKDNTPPWAEPLLKEVKLTPVKAQLDANKWTGGGAHRLNTFQKCWDDWREIDPTATTVAKDFLAADSFEQLVVTAARFVDVKPPIPPAAPPGKEIPAEEVLIRAITALHAALDKPLTDAQKKDLAKQVKAVPTVVARAATELLEAVPAALKQRERAFAKFGGTEKLPAAYTAASALGKSYKTDADTLKMIQDVDMVLLVEGGLTLARAMDRAEKLLAKVPAEKFEFAWETPIGAIALNGTQENTYGAGPYLLTIDTGGNDKYTSGGATTSATHPVSLLIDVAGDDTYEAKGAAFGAGVLGYGFLLDAAGNDTYRTDFVGCGASSFGVGVLVDRAGKDKYEVDRTGQGGAFVGVGVLADYAGDDEYRCFMKAQGFGAVKGCGVLLDREGNDKYDANDTDIRYPSPQDAKHNTSLAQGCAFGLRDHPGAGNSLAGGVGILIDGKGNDRYSCGVFGQGVSYWYGLGMLIDVAGDDEYTGIWYCQGSGAHYAVGALVDLAGDDKYLTKLTMGQGAGHDYSTAWFHDAAGNDTYECAGGGIGFALYNGVGIFWDGGGDDKYKGGSFGATGETRPEHTCLALFIDEGGKNEFPKDSRAKPNSTWVQPANKDQPLSYGVGIAK